MSFTGKGEVFIRAFSDSTINNIEYQANEVICYFNNVEFDVNYSLNNTFTRQSGTQLMAYSEKNPQSISIIVEGFKSSVWKLIGTSIAATQALKPRAAKVISDAQGDLFLPNSGEVSNVFPIVFDTMEKNLSFTFTPEGKVSNLDADETYIVMFDELKDLTQAHSINTKAPPYFSIQFVQDTLDKQILINVPKASLVVNPTLNFNNDSIVNIPLAFSILDSNIIIYEYE